MSDSVPKFWMNESWRYNAKLNKPAPKDSCSVILRIWVTFLETACGTVIARGWGRKNGELVWNGCGVSVLQEERALEKGGGDGLTAVWIALVLLCCALTMVQIVHFMLCIFYHHKNKQRQSLRKLTDDACRWSAGCPSAPWDEQVGNLWVCRGCPACRPAWGKAVTSRLRVAPWEPSYGWSFGQSDRAVSPCLCPHCVVIHWMQKEFAL